MIKRIQMRLRAMRLGIQAAFRDHWLAMSVALLLVAFVFVMFWPRMVVTIHPGEAGALWSRFNGGTQLEVIFEEGTSLIFPWNRMFIYDTRVQKVDHTIDILSSDGLEIKIHVTTRFSPMPKTVPQLHQRVGPDYVDRVVIPEVTTAVRQVMGQYRPDQLYTVQTEEMQREIVGLAGLQVRDRFVFIDDVLIRRIELPELVQEAIQRKLNQEQAALEYKYRLDREVQEAERKRVEAEGIRDFQAIISQQISTGLLQWKGIEATLELAKSANSKIVVVGSGENGLPIILGNNP